MKLIDNKIYLASKSPRRRELLRQIGIHFELVLLRGATVRDSAMRPADVSEMVLSNELPHDYVTRISNEKALAAWDATIMRQLPLRPVLAADTAVVLDGTVFQKPANREEACAMLTALSGRTHQVLTSVTVHFHKHIAEVTVSSEVTFCSLTKKQLDHYCGTQEPFDKAGGYAIQGNAARFISHISGSYSGVVGLPLFETAKLLSEVGIVF